MRSVPALFPDSAKSISDSEKIVIVDETFNKLFVVIRKSIQHNMEARG